MQTLKRKALVNCKQKFSIALSLTHFSKVASKPTFVLIRPRKDCDCGNLIVKYMNHNEMKLEKSSNDASTKGEYTTSN